MLRAALYKVRMCQASSLLTLLSSFKSGQNQTQESGEGWESTKKPELFEMQELAVVPPSNPRGIMIFKNNFSLSGPGRTDGTK